MIQSRLFGQLQALRNAPRVDLKPVPLNIATLKFKQQPLQSTHHGPQISSEFSSRKRQARTQQSNRAQDPSRNQPSSRIQYSTNRYAKAISRGGVRPVNFQESANPGTNLNTAQTPSSSNRPNSQGFNQNTTGRNSNQIFPTSNQAANPNGTNQGAATLNSPTGTPQVLGQLNAINNGQRSSLLPGAATQYELTPPQSAHVDYQNINGKVTMVAQNATVSDVLNVLAEKEKISFVLSGGSSQTVSFSLQDVPAAQALTSILAMSGHTWKEQNRIVYVTPNTQEANATLTPEFSGKVVKVFDLDYASSKNLSEVVAGMLSNSGKSYVVESEAKNNRKTAEQIIVEDFPGVVERVAQYIQQVDQPPRQVLIEAFVLEVSLGEDEKHGVNFEHIAKISGNDIKLGTIGITPSATSTFFAEIDAPNLKGIIDALKISNDTRTLASPKVMVVNGQESRLQVGQQLGFRVIQQNGNTSLEDVKFIDVGVVLTVTPRISRDGRILMSVKPEVSSGEINVDTGLPEEETSEVDTSVLLSNGKGMVIGGLIQEKDGLVTSKVPVLGDLRGVGGLFRRTAKEKTRSEIIFVLIPRIVEHDDIHDFQNQINQQHSLQRRHSEYTRSTTPLFECEHCPQPRPSFNPQMSPIHREYNGTHYQNYPSHPVDHLPDPAATAPETAPMIEQPARQVEPAGYYQGLEQRGSRRRQSSANSMSRRSDSTGPAEFNRQNHPNRNRTRRSIGG